MRVKLGDVASIKHGFAFPGEFITDEDNGVVLVTPGNFSIGGGFQDDKCKFFSGEVPESYVLKPGDLIVTMTDLSKGIDTLGYGALVPFSKRVYLHNQRIGLLEINNPSIYKDYLVRVLQTRDYQRTIAGSSSGSTVHHTSPSKIESYSFEVPDLETQKRIAGVLSAYDELIENNRRQIKLLEEAAQRLYKEWFVDLKFPGHETTPINNGLPAGWRMGCLDECCTLVKTISKQDERVGDELYIGLEHMPKNSICLYAHGVAADVVGNKTKFRKGDVLFGKIRPYFHKVGLAQFDGVTSTDAIVMRAVEGKQALLLAVASSDEFVSYATATSKTGTKMPRADWAAMKRYQIPIPSDAVASRFEAVYESFASSIAQCGSRIAAAREARDRLLPKLMSGEIEV